jgi:hypothetical protein
MKIYLAARYSRLEQMNLIAAELRQLGHVVTSRWIQGNHRMPDCAVGTRDEVVFRQRFAHEDLDDLRAADCCLSVSEEPRCPTRGGRHVEFGIAIERGLRCIVVGPREHVFHWLPEVEWYPDWSALGEALLQERA